MEWKQRHFHGESEEDSGKREPRDIAAEEPMFSEIGERGEIERTFGEINPEKREQHRNTAQESVNEKFRGSAVAVFAAPDFNEQERGNEAHLVKQKPKDEVLGDERAVERRLHQQHQCAEPGARALGKKREGNDQRRQQHEQKTQAIKADEVF